MGSHQGERRGKNMLKHKSFLAGLVMMATVVFGGVITAHAAVEAGYFDELEGDTIVGWGWDSEEPDAAAEVHVTVTNKQTSEVVGDFRVTASEERDDLKENQVGNGSHGFRIEMDWDSLADGNYLIEGWVGDKKLPNTITYRKGDVEDTQTAAANAPISLGVFRTTGYCPCRQCSEGWGRRTCTGAIATAGHTIAVDPRVIPYGSKVMINGVVYTAEDRGGGVKGNHIDIFYDTHAQTRQHGSRSAEVFLLS